MAFRLPDRTGDTGTYDSTPTPKEIDLDDAGLTALRTFAEAVTDGDFADGDETLVSLVDSSGSWATYEATYVVGTPNKLELDTLVSDEGTLADESAVDVYAATNQKYLKHILQRVTTTVTTANVSAEAGKSYQLTVSGLTADRNFVLPSGSEGDELEVTLATDVPAAYELVIIGDTGVSLSMGGSLYTAAEATRLCVRGERLRFKAHTDGAWYTEDDGRIASNVSLTLSTALTTNPANTNTTVPFDTTVGGSGFGIVTGASCAITIRRAGWYTCGLSLYPNSNISANHEYAARLIPSIATSNIFQARIKAAEASNNIDVSATKTIYLATGETITPALYAETTDVGVDIPTSVTWFFVEESLSGASGGGSFLSTSQSIITTADLELSLNTTEQIDPSGLTADRNIVLPAGAAVGQTCGFILIDDAPAAYELVLKGDTGVTIEGYGGSYTATEATRFFIDGESPLFMSDGANNWLVLRDGRISSYVDLSISTDITTNSAGTTTRIAFDQIVVNRGMTVVTGASCSVAPRRAGRFSAILKGRSYANLSDGRYYSLSINDSSVLAAYFLAYTGAVSSPAAEVTAWRTLSAGDTLEPNFASQDANMGYSSLGSNAIDIFQVQEVF